MPQLEYVIPEYSITPELRVKLTAEDLIFPEKPVPNYEALAEHPVFAAELEGSGYLEDIGPRGPFRSTDRETPEARSEEDPDSGQEDEDHPQDKKKDASPYSLQWYPDAKPQEASEQETHVEETCDCPPHKAGSVCGLDETIRGRKRDRKFPRPNIPLSCAFCLNR